ncbi:MAG: amidase [Nevskiales bacterium]
MRLHEYSSHDAISLAQLIRRGEVSATEIQRCALEAIDLLNPRLNFISGAVQRAPAWQEGKAFSGVPFLLKEGHGTQGFPLGMGSRLLAGLSVPQDNEMSRRLKNTGVALLAATTAPEFGAYPVTESSLHGATRNPWNLDHSPGGSSGGASAAVAAGVVPVAQTSDGGGSIRGPAHCTGLFGLKPSRGRTPHFSTLFGLDSWHVSSRTVRDSAAFLDLLHGAADGARFHIGRPERPYLDEVEREPGYLRIGICRSAPLSVPLSAECLSAVDATAKLLQGQGHHVEEASPKIAWTRFMQHFLNVWSHMLPLRVKMACAMLGREASPGMLEAKTLQLMERGRGLGVEDLLLAEAAFEEARIAVDHYFRSYDLWLSPAGVSQAPRIGSLAPSDGAGSFDEYAVRALDAYAAFTPLFNVSGHPAASVPVIHGSNGLPVGLQFAAAMGQEATIFRIAGQLERAHPWIGRRPPHSIFAPHVADSLKLEYRKQA